MRTGLMVVALSVALAGCSDAKKRAEERQRALDEAKAARKDAADQPAAVPQEAVKLEPVWDDAAYVRVSADAACPEGMWALFPGEAPGDGEEKKANAQKRAGYAQALRASTVLVKLRAPAGVKLLAYDAPKGQFPLELLGTIDCSDSFGRVAIAWTDAQAIVPGLSAAKAGAEVAQNIWQAEALRYELPMKSMSEAKAFAEKNRFQLEARLLLKLGKVEVDKKTFKTTKVTQGDITLGGGAEDWGAGRLVHASLLGVRLATDREKTVLLEKK
ncbi:MAG: hypothetical protein ACOZIN_03925 [Myxococcota bacterium]